MHAGGVHVEGVCMVEGAHGGVCMVIFGRKRADSEDK